MNPNLDQAAKAMRNLALSCDAEAEALLERGFEQWRDETVFPQAVNRWITEACHD